MSWCSSQLPEELICEVLARLPAKSVQRFRCVSRSWKTLIGSNYFITLHLKASKAKGSGDKPTILLLTESDGGRIYSTSSPVIHLVDVDSPPGSNQMRSTWLKPDPRLGRRISEIQGCYNGLVCLKEGYYGNLLLWNPTIRKYWELPVPIADEDPLHHLKRMCGFGYDDVEDDHKIVRVVEYYVDYFASPTKQSVQLYSTRSNSWRRLPQFPYFVGKYSVLSGVANTVNHALHWIMEEDGNRFVILAFDLRTETIRMVPPPPPPPDQGHQPPPSSAHDDYVGEIYDVVVPFKTTSLGVLDDRLCVMYFHVEPMLSLWIMEEYGVKDSWTKRIILTAPPNFDLSEMSFLVLLPYSGSYDKRSTQIYFYDYMFIYCYDTNTHAARRSIPQPPFACDPKSSDIRINAFPFISSLVNPFPTSRE
ncbi:OLC1v1007480C1 [Oldenlandia corymbosa var. corymbosa]|uniref:OLC1v1007480C1 n=1 Tax=Oldenlandia corymbosa var. corymbosa TaxID=529605 RepID=A0AAV1DMQ7_OLDCO|nr:OLC1v1007480C1 [Oldenlandia corymbosa var. corymbosa]